MTKEQELVKSFIPRIEVLVNKNEDHLTWLYRMRRFSPNKKQVDLFISRTKNELEHFKMRLQQYRDFIVEEKEVYKNSEY